MNDIVQEGLTDEMIKMLSCLLERQAKSRYCFTSVARTTENNSSSINKRFLDSILMIRFRGNHSLLLALDFSVL